MRLTLAGPRRRALLAVGLALCVIGAAGVTASAGVLPFTDVDPGQAVSAVPAAQCGPGSLPQTDIDGRIPITDRTNGRDRQGYSCNLKLVGHYAEGEGAGWMNDWYDHCDYYDTLPPGGASGASSSSSVRVTKPGVQVVDVSDPAHPVRTAVLDTRAMDSPHESLKVSQKRGLLAADHLSATGFDIYDVSQDCAHPKLLASIDTDSSITGHEGDFAPDGMTYYGENGGTWAMDVSDPTRPRLITGGLAGGHGLAVSDDGNTLYTVIASTQVYSPAGGAPLVSTESALNGLIVSDVSKIQHRVPPYTQTVLAQLTWTDGAIAQVPVPFSLNGHPYLAFVDEAGWGNARIIDVADRTHPSIVSRLHLAINLLQNRALSTADGAAGLIQYDGHYCSVPKEVNPDVLLCAYAWSGVRVFDIRDPLNPKQIAYYIPPAFTGAAAQKLTGSSDQGGGGSEDNVDRCSSKIRLARDAKGYWDLWVQCQENEFQVLRFTNGVFPLTPGYSVTDRGSMAATTTSSAPAVPAGAAAAAVSSPNTAAPRRPVPLAWLTIAVGLALLLVHAAARRQPERPHP